jgi:hypothetical protein
MADCSLLSLADPLQPHHPVGEMDPFPFPSSPTSLAYTPDTMVAHSPRNLQDHLYASFLEGSTADVALHVSGSWHAVYKLHRVVLIQAVSSLHLSHPSRHPEPVNPRHHRNSSDASLPQGSQNHVSARDHHAAVVLNRFTFTFQIRTSQDQVCLTILREGWTDNDHPPIIAFE